MNEQVRNALRFAAWTLVSAIITATLIMACKTTVPTFTAADEKDLADYESVIDACKAEARDAGKPNQVKAFDVCWAKKGAK